MINVYVITAWLTTITASCLGIFTYLKNPRRNINKRWLFMNTGIAFWSLFLGFMFNSKDAKSGLIYSRILMIGANLIPVTFYHFILAFLDRDKDEQQTRLLFMGYAVTLGLLLVNCTPLFIKSTTYKLLVRCFYPDAGPFFIFYILHYFGLTGYACFLMYQTAKVSTGQKKNQIKYCLFGSVVGFLGGATTFPLWYQIRLPPFGSHFVWLYTLVVTYAILRYRLMDITVAITRTGIFIAVYTLVLGLPFAIGAWLKNWLIGVFGAGWWMLPLGLMAILATVGPFIYIYINRKAEERLLKEQRRYQQTLKQASVGMTQIRNLRKLLDLITHIVTKTVRISYAAIYLYNKDTDEYVLQVSRDKGRVAIPKITSSNPLISWITLKRDPLIYEEIKRQMEDVHDPIYKLLEENMRLLTASVVIPSFLEDRFMGFIVLGDKLSGQIYTPEDLNVFQILASQAALAIENAQFYEETKQMQDQLAQAEKMATVGTMADGLSHQINNRFYALSLIAADTIDTIKMTDTSKCSTEVKEAFHQISHALARIEDNVIQGGQVVKGILKYTRKGDEGLEAVTLDQIIDGALDMLQYKINLSEIDIVRNYPKDLPKIKVNSVQLQEVFFNFGDNGYDATIDRKTLFKEESYRGKITISARPLPDGKIEIRVEDNGIGIKEENFKKVFTPFFTGKASSHKGTGLGLYVIKRIIEDYHKGRISFTSEYGKGTTFIIELSLA